MTRIQYLISRVPRSVWRGIWTAVLIMTLAALLLGVLILAVSACMKSTTAGAILDAEEATDRLLAEDFDCILVLGAGVRADGTPSPMLADRVSVACELYEVAREADVPLLMSGDHTGDYNEVGVMKSMAVESGIPSEDIFLDHEGYSTYESLWRAKEVFGVKKILIVSQGYHLHRALHIAEALGMEAVGVPADLRDYYLQTRYELREMLARFKDLFAAAGRKAPAVYTDRFDLSGDGNLT